LAIAAFYRVIAYWASIRYNLITLRHQRDKTMVTISKRMVGHNVCVDESRRLRLLDTPGDGCHGMFMAPSIYGECGSDDWHAYIETNGDPILLPHADHPDELQAALASAGVTLAKVEAVIGMRWSDWSN
jgi:hypothetical protein